MEEPSAAVRMFRGNGVSSRVLEWMLTDGESLSDVTVCVGEKRFFCHRVVLAANSPVFRAMFAVDMKESNTGVLSLPPEVTASMFNALRDFMYGRPLRVTSDDALGLYKFVEQYEIAMSDLQNFFDNLLISALTVDNVICIRQHADALNAFRLRRACDRFITLRLPSLCTANSFLEASIEAVEAVLLAPTLVSRDILGPRSAQYVFAAALAWLRYDKTRVYIYLDRVLRTIRLDHLSLPALIRASREPLIEDSITFRHKLLRAFSLSTERYITFGSIGVNPSVPWIPNHLDGISTDDEREYDDDEAFNQNNQHRRSLNYRRRIDFFDRFHQGLSHVRMRTPVTSSSFVHPRLPSHPHSHSHLTDHLHALSHSPLVMPPLPVFGSSPPEADSISRLVSNPLR